jgi:hypothetical protein
MTEVRVLSASGQIGSGFLESSFARGISLEPHVIACDGGSTDAGPYHLGSGKPHFSRPGVKRDMRLMMQGRNKLGVPLIVGSCGFAGGDAGVDWMVEITREIAREEGLKFRLATVRSEQDKKYLKRQFREGRITPLNPAPPISEAIIDRSAHIVGMMGHAPIQDAIEKGADIILCGRASDTSLFATVPLMKGSGAGPAWHSAKILECGTAATVNRKRPDSIMAWVRDNHFDIEPMDMQSACSPQSVASHTLYENADPFLITEPDGTIDCHASRYEALDDRTVRVHNSQFIHAERTTIKLEGAESVGHQAIIIGGVREPYIIRQLDDWLDVMRTRFAVRVEEIFGGKVGPDDYNIHARVYGRDGVMGKLEPLAHQIGHEVCILFTVTAPDEATTEAIAKTFAHFALHYPIPEWGGLISGLAFPMAPAHLSKGEVFRFNLNHVVTPEHELEMFRTELMEV